MSVNWTIRDVHIELTWSLASLALAYDSMVVGLAAFQRRLQYFPDRRLVHLAQTDMRGGEELRLATEDGETLVAWLFPAKDGLPLILYFHGNAGALVDRVPRFRMFTAKGYGLLAVSYRGYGGSTGSPTQIGLMQDGEAAYREARARGYDGDRIVILGDVNKRQTNLWQLKRHVGAGGIVSPMRIAGIDDWSWRNGFTGSIKAHPAPSGRRRGARGQRQVAALMWTGSITILSGRHDGTRPQTCRDRLVA